MGAKDGLRGLPRDEFFDRLGNHINEINAIHPFREGNGRTMRHHAAQLARDAGHPIRIASIDKTAWMDASRHGFLTGDHRGMTAALAGTAIRRDLAPEARIGPAGIAPGYSPGQAQLAEPFLKNTPEKNNADPRLAPAQAIVDAALKTARDRGDSARMVSSVGESTRQLVADRIKTGGALDGDLGRAAPAPAPPPRDKDRSR